MKKEVLLLIAIPIIALVSCGTAATTPAPLPHSAKGYEIYSWQQRGEWRFTLIVGTNRMKFADEIIPSTTSATSDMRGISLDALLGTLARLHSGEWVFWNTLPGTATAFPPQEIIGRVTARAQQSGLQLSVGQLYGGG